MDWTEEWNVAREAAWAAGQEVVKRFRKPITVAYKGTDDPLTEADLHSNETLKKTLLSRFPNDGWLSEETKDDGERLTKERVWIVDPLDGTKEFSLGIPEFAVSVALSFCGVPVVACVYNPATDEMFAAVQGCGAWREGVPIRAERPIADRPVVLASRSEVGRGEWDCFVECFEVRPMGSIAYKMALVAAGQADATFSLGPKNEWDIAAGVLIVAEAGGIARDAFLNSFQFNKATTLVHGVIAGSVPGFKKTWSLLENRTNKERTG